MFELQPKIVAAFIVIVLLWTIESTAPLVRGREKHGRHYGVNLLLGLANAVVVSLLLAGALLAATVWAETHHFGVLHWLALPAWAAWPLAIVFIDFWQYCWHVMSHKIPFLWRFHKVHHADAEMDASTGVRFHTGEVFLSTLSRIAVFPLLGLELQHLAVYELLALPVILFHHSNIGISARTDRLLRPFIVTPFIHWVHHSNYQPETDSNYASLFSIWDRIFGTFQLREDPRSIALGLEEYGPRETRNFFALWLLPFRKK